MGKKLLLLGLGLSLCLTAFGAAAAEVLKPVDALKPAEAMKPAEAKRPVEAMKAAEEKKPAEEKVMATKDPPDAKYTITGRRIS